MCLAIFSPAFAEDAKPEKVAGNGLSLVVMDPLALPLSCPCVEGYAQRNYDKLGEFLTERLGRPVQVTFAESFEKALAKENCKAIDIAIGKDSVVRHDAAAAKMKVTPLAQLSGKDGVTTQTGLIVVRSADPAQKVDDLRGYRILFGTTECDEKFAAPRALLTSAGVDFPAVDKTETTQSCSDGACKIIEWGDKEKAAAVISSYAAPLLEGCGTIKKGDLRVVGETEPVPFVTAFTTEWMRSCAAKFTTRYSK
jgi:ABC-type phosphate/phosphonate transport system substrate-binding protein